MEQKSALVTCHAERPLDDRVWTRLLALIDAQPGGFPIVPLLRPPDREAGEDEARWLERARVVAARGPVGLHTHWTSPTPARPRGGDAAARVRDELAWLRRNGLEPVLFCGGGWYTDDALRELLRVEGVVDCTATTFEPPVPQPHLVVDGPRDGLLPATHSLGRIVRGVVGPLPRFVHVYFHDTDLLRPRRRLALASALRVLGLRREPADLRP
jgi:hypothetical protein